MERKLIFLNREVYWMVVYNCITGDFLQTSDYGFSEKSVQNRFERTNNDVVVIHVGKGDTPPKSFRSLPFYSG